jgi:hypothetical protein
MGANDSEIPSINRIIEAYMLGEIEGEKAISEAYKILNSKADYH